MSLKSFGQYAKETYWPAGELILPASGVYLISIDHPVIGAIALGAGALGIHDSYRSWKNNQIKPTKNLREPGDEI